MARNPTAAKPFETDLTYCARDSKEAQTFLATIWGSTTPEDALLILAGTDFGKKRALENLEVLKQRRNSNSCPRPDVIHAYGDFLKDHLQKLHSDDPKSLLGLIAQMCLFQANALSPPDTISMMQTDKFSQDLTQVARAHIGEEHVEKLFVENFDAVATKKRYEMAILLLASGKEKLPAGRLVSAIRTQLNQESFAQDGVQSRVNQLALLGQAPERIRNLVCDMLLGLSGRQRGSELVSQTLHAWGETGKPCLKRALLTSFIATSEAPEATSEIVPQLEQIARKAKENGSKNLTLAVQTYFAADQAKKIREWNKELEAALPGQEAK